jgi:hypothetical protein
MQEALDLTWKTLNGRMRNYRRAGFASLILAALWAAALLSLRSAWVLYGLGVFPLLGFALVRRDQALVFAWQRRVLELWRAGDLQLAIFIKTLHMQLTPLKSALRSMADTLPVPAGHGAPAPEEARAAQAACEARRAESLARWNRAAALAAAVFLWALAIPLALRGLGIVPAVLSVSGLAALLPAILAPRLAGIRRAAGD